MKHITKVFALLMALVLLSSCGLAEVSEIAFNPVKPFTDTPVDVKIVVYPQEQIVFSEFNKDDFVQIKLLDEISGMNIDWEVRDPAAINETLSTLMASGDLPDMIQGMWWTASEIADYGVSQGLLYPVDTLLEYMPIFSDILEQHPDLKATITAPDGHIYGFPQLLDTDSYRWPQWLNKEWMDKLNLEAPTTLDEFYQVLKAFKENDANGNGDANDEIPWTASWSEGYNVEGWLLNTWGLVGSGETIVVDRSEGEENARLAYAAYAPEYKEYLAFMNKLYTEGLIDPDMFTQNTAQCIAKLADDTAGGWLGDANIQNAVSGRENCFNIFTGISPLVKAEGETPISAGYNFYECFCSAAISADVTEEQAIALARLIDYYYSVEFWNFVTYGPAEGDELDPEGRGCYPILKEDGTYSNRDYRGNNGSYTRWTYQLTYVNFWHMPGFASGNVNYRDAWGKTHPGSICDLMNQSKIQSIDYNGYDQWALKLKPYYVDGVPEMFMDEDDNEQATLLIAQLDSYAKNTAAKFITGELDLDKDYADFISTLEQYGVKELEEIENKYYDIYKSNK